MENLLLVIMCILLSLIIGAVSVILASFSFCGY